MILASHQPNFMPYMGYIYKMYCCDVFTLSNGVKFSRNQFHNYNFISENGKRAKLTIPVSQHNCLIKDVQLDQWEFNKRKILRRIQQCYSRYPYFDEVFPAIREIFDFSDGTLAQLNKNFLLHLAIQMDMKCMFIDETEFDLAYNDPSEDIVQLCLDTGCKKYLSGTGASSYLDERLFKINDISLFWSNYEPVEYGSKIENASVLDYLMLQGYRVPRKWEEDRYKYHEKL